jgi:hypothetical protein
MAGSGTVEWGEDRPVRLLDRLFGNFGGGGLRLNAPSVAGAVVATALFVAAELLPWMTVEQVVVTVNQPGTVFETRDVSLDSVGTGISTAYYGGLLVLLSAFGLVQASRPHARRALTATGVGLSAGMLVLLVGIVRRAAEGGEIGTTAQIGLSSVTSSSVGAGPYLAMAGVLMMAAAFVVGGWRPSGPVRRPVIGKSQVDGDDDGEESGPIDLTVTPA